MHADTAAPPSLDRAERRLVMLDRLAEIGMALAEGVRRQAQDAEAAGEAPADLSLKFARIARAVRQTLALQARFEAEVVQAAREVQAREQRQAAQAAEARRRQGHQRRMEAGEIVERLFETEYADYDLEAFEGEVAEWLEDDRGDEAFAQAPIGELVFAICQDLKLDFDWAKWPDEDWAIEAAAAERRHRAELGLPLARPREAEPGSPPPPDWPGSLICGPAPPS